MGPPPGGPGGPGGPSGPSGPPGASGPPPMSSAVADAAKPANDQLGRG